LKILHGLDTVVTVRDMDVDHIQISHLRDTLYHVFERNGVKSIFNSRVNSFRKNPSLRNYLKDL